MRKLLFIFVLLSCNSEKMTVSDALPIKFWPIGDDTYNERVVGFVDSQCHFQEFSCIDPIKLQVSNKYPDVLDSYDLRIEDSNGATILTEPFIKTDITKAIGALSFINGLFTATLSPWLQYNTGKAFVWANPSNEVARCNTVGTGEINSQIIYQERSGSSYYWPSGAYSFSYLLDNFSIGSTDGRVKLLIVASDDAATWTTLFTSGNLNGGGGSFGGTPSVTTTKYWRYIGFKLEIVSGLPDVLNVDVNQFTILTSPANEITGTHHDLDFTALSLSETFCDQYVRFYIQQNGTDSHKSDLIKFNSSIALNQGYGTVLISYKSTKNFAGIVYPNDGNYFNIRIPARFFQARNKGTETSIELSNSKVINTSSSLKKQVLFSTILLPDYLHDIIELALAHSVSGSVNIDGYEWTKEEGYERNLPDAKCPKQSGKVWLTRKNQVVRNII